MTDELRNMINSREGEASIMFAMQTAKNQHQVGLKVFDDGTAALLVVGDADTVEEDVTILLNNGDFKRLLALFKDAERFLKREEKSN